MREKVVTMAGRKEMFWLSAYCCLSRLILRCAASRKGASRSWGCDSKPFCCTWQLLPILSCVMDKSRTRLRLPAAYRIKTWRKLRISTSPRRWPALAVTPCCVACKSTCGRRRGPCSASCSLTGRASVGCGGGGRRVQAPPNPVSCRRTSPTKAGPKHHWRSWA